MTPAFGATGTFTILDPFTPETSIDYTCNGINSFESLAEQGIDVYETYYEPNGISEDDYNTDKANGENIVTLYAADDASLVLPSSYISDAPTTTAVLYRQCYLVVDAGALPDSIDVSDTLDTLAETVTANLGVTATASLVTSPLASTVTYDEYESNEAARLANIDYTYNATTELADTRQLLEDARTKINVLTAIIVSLQS